MAWLNPKGPSDEQFLIDANVYPGNSGGPVIKAPNGSNPQGGFQLGGRTALLGIVVEAPGQSGDYQLKVPGQLRPIRIHQEIPVGGTGIAEPASKVAKLLDLIRTKTK